MTKPATKGQKTTFAGASAAVILAIGMALLGSEGRRYEAYYDGFGIATVCDGITGPEVKFGKVYTDAECDTLRDIYVRRMLARMGRCVPKRELEFYEIKAWGHFAYNVGEGAFCASTAARMLNDPAVTDTSTVCPQMLKYRFGGKNPATGKKWDCSIAADRARNKCYGVWLRRQWEYQTCKGATPDITKL